jgi:DNA primase
MRMFKCFGCQKHGSVIDFVMEIEGISFWEACKQLAERHGIPLPKRDMPSDEATRRRASILEMHEAAQRMFRAALEGPQGSEARAYLKKRGVSPQLIEEFGLGYSDRGGQALTRKFQQDGLTAEQLEQSGLVSRREDGSGYFDRFRGRLMFPIHNESGKLIAFAGRALGDEQPKYLNSPETEIYRKSTVLYNLHRARKAIRQVNHVILVEGYMDAIGLSGAGIGEVVASCGTSLTEPQVRMLHRHSENVVVNFDPDPAGTSAAARSIQMLLTEGARIRVLELSGGLDPDEYVKEHGAEGYRAVLGKAPRYFEWLATRVRSQHDTRNADGRVAAFKAMLPAIHRISDRIERAAMAKEVAELLGIEQGMVLDQFRKMAIERGPAPQVARGPEIPHVEKLMWHCLLTSSDARRSVLARLGGITFERPPATARLLAAAVAAGADFTYEALEGRLNEADRTLLASLAFAEYGSEESDSDPVAQVEACLDRLEATSSSLARRSALKARVKAAEKEGNLAEALRLNAEVLQLEKAEKMPVPQPSKKLD